MEYTNLGRTGLKVSRLCLGTMKFGPQTTEPDSYAIMDRALEHGLNFMDTANVYGWQTGEGVTEQIVGRWFAQGGGGREKTGIATKLYGGVGRRARGEDGHRDQAVWRDGRLAQPDVPVRTGDPAAVRRIAEAAADRLHRP